MNEIQLQAKPAELKAAKTIVANMLAAGLQDVHTPVWIQKTVLAVAPRAAGNINEEYKSIVFAELPKELKDLENKPLKLRGTGPTLRIAIAVAVADHGWTINGKSGKIKEGDQMIRVFS